MDTGANETETVRFRLLDEAELNALPNPRWLVDGVVPEGGFIELHGPPGSYKSFLAVDLAMSVATGSEWAGRPVKQGPVVYVAAEGASGYKLRVASWRLANGADEPAPVYFVTEAVQLLDSQATGAFLSAIREREPQPALVVIDTLSRCFVGEDENSAKSMSRLIAAVDRLRGETGATVLLVHHTNKTGKADALPIYRSR
jgi:RecA-family ATPase